MTLFLPESGVDLSLALLIFYLFSVGECCLRTRVDWGKMTRKTGDGWGWNNRAFGSKWSQLEMSAPLDLWQRCYHKFSLSTVLRAG